MLTETKGEIAHERAHLKNIEATSDTGVECKIDGVWVHSIPLYLSAVYPEITLDEYKDTYDPRDPEDLYSQTLINAKNQKERNMTTQSTVAKSATKKQTGNPDHTFAKIFDLGDAAGAKNLRGEDIYIKLIDTDTLSPELLDYIPEVDERYIFPLDNLKSVLMGMVLNIPVLLWGPYGTGKTTLVQQFCARTKRPTIRVQHTVSTEEAHLLGQYVVRNGSTEFEPGPLAYAMRYGLVYIADEYDFALPSVCSVYQPVLEGQKLIIKEAPPEWRVVTPHENFRFAATGNTNGSGDETGMYQGTQIQNAANYSRFGITLRVEYMPKLQEVAVVASQGEIHEKDATKLVELAGLIREGYERGDCGATISPRELIRAALLGRVIGGDWKQAFKLAYINRMSKSDKDYVTELAQRIFG